MTFYPFLRNDFFSAELDLHCFSPNSSQPFKSKTLNLYITWSDGNCWQTRFLYEINNGESIRVTNSLIDLFDVPRDRLILLFFTELILSNTLQTLSKISFDFKSLPVWRATISLEANPYVTSSYQGEIDCFRPKSTFLTFSYLYQPNLINYLFSLNLQASPILEDHKLSISNCISPGLSSSVNVQTNTLNIIPLDDHINGNEFYSISSRTLSGIPLFISTDENKTFLSIEHTHPPASSFLHGNRWSLQYILKTNWFSRMLENTHDC